MSLARLQAVAEGLLVSLIWASSFVFIKMGLDYLPPLTLAGMRYFTAFIVLLPLLAHHGGLKKNLASDYWKRLFLIGVCAYTIGNGCLFWSLQYLPATTGSFLFSLLPLPVLFLGILWLREVPAWWQGVGLVVTLGGSTLFFSPGIKAGEPLGVAVETVGLLAFAVFGIMGREVARERLAGTLSLTALPLGFGGGLLLLIALLLEGIPSFSPQGWGIVLWLAVVNTALAYLLYNHSLKVLTALEMNVLLNLSPLGTAFLAWVLLGERLTPVQIIGMVTVILGVAVVQWRRGGAAVV